METGGYMLEIKAFKEDYIDEAARLFADEKNGRIAGAYAKEEYRGKGIGKALLREVVKWACENGCARLYVEGESANIYGGNFWMRHFTPVAFSVRRCIDERITIE